MRTLMTLLIFACVFSVVSAITGIQGFHVDSHTGTVVWYWHGYGRLYALGYAAVFGLAFYGIYMQYPLAWKLGWVALCFSFVTFLFEMWRSTRSQPDRSLILFFSVAAAVAMVLYWGSWWRKQRSYFFDHGDEPT